MVTGIKPSRQMSRSEQLRKEREQKTNTNSPNANSHHPFALPVSSQSRVQHGKHSQNKKRFHATTPQPVRVFSRSGVLKPAQSSPISLPKVPVINRISGNVRKKWTIPLRERGSELILPAMPVLNGGSRWISGILSVLLAAILFAYAIDPQFKVSAIQFEGLKRIYTTDVELALRLYDKPIYTINPEQIKSVLSESFPELIDPDITIGIPAIIKIKTSERQPVIEWNYNGLALWIDHEGFIFLPRGEIDRTSLIIINSDVAPPAAPPAALSTQEIINLPTATPTPEAYIVEEYQPVVMENYQYIDPAIIQAAEKLTASIPAGTLLVYSEHDGIGWSDPKGWNVYVGLDLADLDLKLVEYQSIVSKMADMGIKPSMISVEHLSAPFFRK